MKHKQLFKKATIFGAITIASLVGVSFSQSVEQVLIFTFITGISMGVVAVYVSEIIRKTKL